MISYFIGRVTLSCVLLSDNSHSIRWQRPQQLVTSVTRYKCTLDITSVCVCLPNQMFIKIKRIKKRKKNHTWCPLQGKGYETMMMMMMMMNVSTNNSKDKRGKWNFTRTHEPAADRLVDSNKNSMTGATPHPFLLEADLTWNCVTAIKSDAQQPTESAKSEIFSSVHQLSAVSFSFSLRTLLPSRKFTLKLVSVSITSHTPRQ